MNFKTSLIAEAAWVLVEIALTLAAIFGSPQEVRTPQEPASAIGCENCDVAHTS